MRRRDLWLLPLAGVLGRAQTGVLAALAAAQKIPGLGGTVERNGKVVYAEAFGEATGATRFRIGSLSKLLTAAAAARLYQRGMLDLDAPVQTYAPWFPDKGAPISARQLLGHLAGIRHYGGGEYVNRTHYRTVRESLRIFEDSPLVAPPGTKYAYSSYGYNLLGAVLEGAAKRDYLTVIQREVLDPLKMKSTVVDDPSRQVDGRSRFYDSQNGRIEESPAVDLTDRLPSGGFLSTAGDLARFGAAHLTDGFLKSATRALVFTSQKTTDGKETGVGFGWRLASIAGERVYHHGGDAMGGRAFLLLRPQHGIAAATVCNLSFARIAETELMALSEPFAGDDHDPRPQWIR
ncbi:MAG: beta-lactamase family protein [Acidobacteriia bacterium]|nr:beta-lactamase family protein [Terriglobia bacterium]